MKLLLFTIFIYFNVFSQADSSQSFISENGVIKINLFNENADVFINDKLIGKGSQIINGLKAGHYRILAKCGSNEQVENIELERNEIRTINISIFKNINSSKRITIIINPEYSLFFKDSLRCSGPSIELGIQKMNWYYGIGFNCLLFSEASNYLLGGSLFKCRYLFSYYGIANVAPEIMLGYWYFNYQIPDTITYQNPYGNLPDVVQLNKHKELIAGAGLHLSAGYNWLFLQGGYSFLFGRTIGHLLKLGIIFKI